MNAAIAERLRDLLERRWTALDLAHRSWNSDSTQSRWALLHALSAYADAFVAEPTLAALLDSALEGDVLCLRLWEGIVTGWTSQFGASQDPAVVHAVTRQTVEDRARSLVDALREIRDGRGPEPERKERRGRLEKAVPGWQRLLVEVEARELQLRTDVGTGPALGSRVVAAIVRARPRSADPATTPSEFDPVRFVWNGAKERPWFDEQKTNVRRFHDWVLDQLAVGAATTTILERFVRGVTLFARDELRDDLLAARPPGDTSNRDERLACLRLAAWLHGQGLDPFNEVQLGNGRADVAVAEGPNAVAIEAKVVREGDDDGTIRDRLLGGLAQARVYADRLGQVTGYLVVFWLADDVFLERREELRFGDGVVRVLVVDLRSKPPSELGGVRTLPLPVPEGAG